MMAAHRPRMPLVLLLCLSLSCFHWSESSSYVWPAHAAKVMFSGLTAEQMKDCKTIKANWATAPTGTYNLTGIGKVSRCNMDVPKGATTILRRGHNLTFAEFETGWDDYVNGLGSPGGEFWIGLEAMHVLTNTLGNTHLRVDMVGPDGTDYYIIYDGFSIGDASSDYRIDFQSKVEGTAADWLTFHKGQSFITSDHGAGCANSFRAGWWYKSCYRVLLTGIQGYRQEYNSGGQKLGVHWYPYSVYYTWDDVQAEMMVY